MFEKTAARKLWAAKEINRKSTKFEETGKCYRERLLL